MDFTSEPAEGAVVYDWRSETLVLDIQNSLGERFHSEIPPNAKDDLYKRASDRPDSARLDRGKATIVNMWLMRPKYGQLTF